MHMPCLLVLPTLFVQFVMRKQCTPFELHQFISATVTSDDYPVTIVECQFLLDSCIMALCQEDVTSTTMSALAYTLEAVLSTEPIFHKWAFWCMELMLGPIVQHSYSIPTPSISPAPDV